MDLIKAFLEYLENKPEIQNDFQIISMMRIDEKIQYEVLDYSKSRELYEKLNWDLRGI